MSAQHHIRIDSLGRSYGDRRIVDDLSFVVDHRERLGLIGENGAGKSTLLRLMAGIEAPDAGTVSRPERVGLLGQEVSRAPGDTVGGLIDRALVEVRALESELERAAAAVGRSEAADERYAAALAEAERLELWSTDARVAGILAGLGVDGLPRDRELDRVSGGQRSRLALTGLLLSRPTALLLDEPTNHLDDSAVAFLGGQLLAWQGPVVFASHDRAFLDEVATALLDIDPSRSGASRFGGNYSDYLLAKAAERERWRQQFTAEQKLEGQLRSSLTTTARSVAHGRGPTDNDKFIHAFKGANVDRQVSRRLRNVRGRLDTLVENRVRKPAEVVSFAGIPHGIHAPDDGPLIAVRDARIADRLDVPLLSIDSGDRLLVTGANGAGKSTLLGVLAGGLHPDAGTVTRRRGLRVALLEQDVRFAAPELSSARIYESTLGERRAAELPLTALGLIAPRDQHRPVAELSVGQQRRLALALIIARPPHLFLLDEPSNHLSLALATELEDALGGYPGAVVVASHDRWLRRRWSDPELVMRDGRVVTD